MAVWPLPPVAGGGMPLPGSVAGSTNQLMPVHGWSSPRLGDRPMPGSPMLAPPAGLMPPQGYYGYQMPGRPGSINVQPGLPASLSSSLSAPPGAFAAAALHGASPRPGEVLMPPTLLSRINHVVSKIEGDLVNSPCALTDMNGDGAGSEYMDRSLRTIEACAKMQEKLEGLSYQVNPGVNHQYGPHGYGPAPGFQNEAPATPIARALVNGSHAGRPDYIYVGVDRNRDGVPDALQVPGAPAIQRLLPPLPEESGANIEDERMLLRRQMEMMREQCEHLEDLHRAMVVKMSRQGDGDVSREKLLLGELAEAEAVLATAVRQRRFAEEARMKQSTIDAERIEDLEQLLSNARVEKATAEARARQGEADLIRITELERQLMAAQHAPGQDSTHAYAERVSELHHDLEYSRATEMRQAAELANMQRRASEMLGPRAEQLLAETRPHHAAPAPQIRTPQHQMTRRRHTVQPGHQAPNDVAHDHTAHSSTERCLSSDNLPQHQGTGRSPRSPRRHTVHVGDQRSSSHSPDAPLAAMPRLELSNLSSPAAYTHNPDAGSSAPGASHAERRQSRSVRFSPPRSSEVMPALPPGASMQGPPDGTRSRASTEYSTSGAAHQPPGDAMHHARHSVRRGSEPMPQLNGGGYAGFQQDPVHSSMPSPIHPAHSSIHSVHEADHYPAHSSMHNQPVNLGTYEVPAAFDPRRMSAGMPGPSVYEGSYMQQPVNSSLHSAHETAHAPQNDDSRRMSGAMPAPSTYADARRMSEGRPAPDAQQMSGGMPALDARRMSEGRPAPDAQQMSGGMPAPDARRMSADMPAPDARRMSAGMPAPDARRMSSGMPAPDARRMSGGMPAPGGYAHQQVDSRRMSGAMAPPSPDGVQHEQHEFVLGDNDPHVLGNDPHVLGGGADEVPNFMGAWPRHSLHSNAMTDGQHSPRMPMPSGGQDGQHSPRMPMPSGNSLPMPSDNGIQIMSIHPDTEPHHGMAFHPDTQYSSMAQSIPSGSDAFQSHFVSGDTGPLNGGAARQSFSNDGLHVAAQNPTPRSDPTPRSEQSSDTLKRHSVHTAFEPSSPKSTAQEAEVPNAIARKSNASMYCEDLTMNSATSLSDNDDDSKRDSVSYWSTPAVIGTE